MKEKENEKGIGFQCLLRCIQCLLFSFSYKRKSIKRKSRNAFFLRTIRLHKKTEREIKTTMETQKDWIGEDHIEVKVAASIKDREAKGFFVMATLDFSSRPTSNQTILFTFLSVTPIFLLDVSTRCWSPQYYQNYITFVIFILCKCINSIWLILLLFFKTVYHL